MFESVTWFLLIAFGQKTEEREKLKKLLNKKEPKLEDLENSWPVHIAKK